MESRTDANWLVEKMQTLSEDNHMSLNVQKSKILFLKGSASCESGDSLELVSQQKDLGLIISRNLSWSDICSQKKTKARRSFWFLKRNCSHKANPVTKLNAYVGYVVPVLTYASQVGNASKTDLKSLERVQRKATAWICGNDADYKQRLLKLNVLPVSLYLELHHILFFNAICQDTFALKSTTNLNPDQQQRGKTKTWKFLFTGWRRPIQNFGHVLRDLWTS